MNLITMAGFSFCYAQSSGAALKNISLDIRAGEIFVICGRSGSGKSTLLRCLKKEITPAGRSTGQFVSELSSQDVAVVFQNPETQLVCGTVMEDLAFTMENLGVDRENMRHGMAETVGFFGLEDLLHRAPNELSGGQKQLAVLCAALMTSPKLLLLDEPVSQLDPIAAKGFLDTLARINAELGVTIVMTGHRLDDCVALADRLAVMDGGTVAAMGETRPVLRRMASDTRLMSFVPEIPRASLLADPEGEACLTAKELRNRLSPAGFASAAHRESEPCTGEKLLSLKNIFFAYGESTGCILRNLSLALGRGERVCLIGGNGSGKTTLLRLIGGIIKPLSGAYRAGKLRIAYMPQEIQSYFRFESVREEIDFDAGGQTADETLLAELGLSGLLQRHPFDLSGGEAGKLVLYCILQKKPDLILMDEPTKGLDPYAKQWLARLIKEAQTTVVCATHDLEFAARFAMRCLMLFDGSIAISSPPRAFLSRNQYYTTALGRAMRPVCPDAILFEDVMPLCEKDARLSLRDS